MKRKIVLACVVVVVVGGLVWWLVAGRPGGADPTCGAVVSENKPTQPVVETTPAQEAPETVEYLPEVVDDEGPWVASPHPKLPPLTGELARRVIDFNNMLIAFERDAAAYRAAHPIYEEVLTLFRDRWNPVRRQIAMARYDFKKMIKKEGIENVRARLAGQYDGIDAEAIGKAMAVRDFSDITKRFNEEIVKSGAIVFVDDYAAWPAQIYRNGRAAFVDDTVRPPVRAERNLTEHGDEVDELPAGSGAVAPIDHVVESVDFELVDWDAFQRAECWRRLDKDLRFLEEIESFEGMHPAYDRAQDGPQMHMEILRVLRSGIPELSELHADDDLVHNAFIDEIGRAYEAAVTQTFNLASLLPADLATRHRDTLRERNALANEREHRLLWYMAHPADSSDSMGTYARSLKEEYRRPNDEANLRREVEWLVPEWVEESVEEPVDTIEGRD